MPFRVTVNTRKNAWLKKELDMRKATHHGLEDIALKTAELLRTGVIHYGLIWKQTLLNSIKVDRVKRSEINIKTIFYGPIIDAGHAIPAAKRLSLLVGWAREKHPEPDAWLGRVFERGWVVTPRPFITDAVKSIDPKVEGLMSLKYKQVK